MYGDLMTFETLQRRRERELALQLSRKRVEAQARRGRLADLATHLRALVRRPSALERKRAELGRIPLFAGLPRRRLDLLARTADVVEVPAGTEVIREGEPGHEFFAISRGEVEISKRGKRVATECDGEVFGEIALLRRIPRTATVRTLAPSRLFVLNEQAFRSLVAPSFS
jgi:Cyclic nucleotide-binding domain